MLFGRFEYQSSGIMDATHLRWFTRQAIADLVRRAGFDVIMQDGSAGLWQPVYRGLRWMPLFLRRRLVRAAVRIMPTIFSCQHVLAATPRAT